MSGYRRALGQLAARYGYTIDPGGKHFKLRSTTTGSLVIAAKSPSDNHRVLRNIESDLRRACRCMTTLDNTT